MNGWCLLGKKKNNNNVVTFLFLAVLHTGLTYTNAVTIFGA